MSAETEPHARDVDTTLRSSALEPRRGFDHTTLWLESAFRIAQRLRSTAVWSGGQCTWLVTSTDPAATWSGRPKQMQAGPWLYQGAAGIALFLAELEGVAGDARLRAVLDGALTHGLETSSGSPASLIGVHNGVTGVAYTLIRYGMATGRGGPMERGLRLLSSLDFRSDVLGTTDVIAGAAGAVPILLQIANWTDQPQLRDAAVGLGYSMIRSARRWPVGWSWPSSMVSNRRDLTGLAHGATGFGHAFVELYAVSRETAFRYAAEEAFAYEDQFFDSSLRNWPDFRNGTLAEALASQEAREVLVEQLRRGEAPSPAPTPFVTSWCHGAPGIGLARLHALEVFGNAQDREMSRAAVATTAAANQRVGNFSLCHGLFGNDATLLEASRVLGDPTLASQATERALQAIDRYELSGRPWPSGSLDGVPDPSLMLGDAGIGYHLLRLADPRVPSILLPTASALSSIAQHAEGEYDSARMNHQREHICTYFPRSLEVVQRLADSPSLTEPVKSPVLQFADALRVLQRSVTPVAVLIEDAARMELARLDMISSLVDMSDTLLDDLRRIPVSDVDWSAARLSLSGYARLVPERHDWDEWLASPTSSPSLPEPLADPNFVLLHRRGATVSTKRLNGLSAAVLSRAALGTTLAQLCAEMRRVVDVAVPDHELDEIVLRVITNAYEAGLVNIALAEAV